VGLQQTFNSKSVGDIEVVGMYTGFFEDMSTGVTFGLKLPTGTYTADGLDRDTQIGSGSTDLLLGGFHRGLLTGDNHWQYFAQARWRFPTDFLIGLARPAPSRGPCFGPQLFLLIALGAWHQHADPPDGNVVLRRQSPLRRQPFTSGSRAPPSILLRQNWYAGDVKALASALNGLLGDACIEELRRK
jgi:hypothetical protein